MSLDEIRIEEIRNEIEKAMRMVENKHGITLKVGTIRYDRNDFRFSTEGQLDSVEPKERRDYKRYRLESRPSLPCIDVIIQIENKPHQVIGLRRKAKRYPVIIQDLTGKQFRCSFDAAEAAKRL